MRIKGATAYGPIPRCPAAGAILWLPAAVFPLLVLLLFPQQRCLAGPAGQNDGGQEAAASRNAVGLATQSQQIRSLQEGIAAHKNMIKDAREQQQGLLQELAKLNQQLAIHNYKCAALKESLAKQETLMAQEHEQLSQTLDERKVLQKHLEKRLTAYYQMGSIGFLNVMFSRKSLTELLSFEEYFHYLVQYDRQSILAFQKKINEQEGLQEKLQQEKGRLQELVDQVAVEERALDDARQEKTALLARATIEEQLYGYAVAEIEKAAAGLTASQAMPQNNNSPTLPAAPAVPPAAEQIRQIRPEAVKHRPAAVQPGEGETKDEGLRIQD